MKNSDAIVFLGVIEHIARTVYRKCLEQFVNIASLPRQHSQSRQVISC